MRLTCLRCGNQMELAASGPRVGTICTCGTEISYPEVYNTGVRPNERAAERLRYRAFRAAGLVKNLGGFAIGMALLGLLFFPLALCGAVLGIYTLTMLRGPLGRYSGRRAAIAAVVVGAIVFATEGGILWSYVSHRRADHFSALQASAADDLRTLLRTERLYKAAQDRFGSIKESRFTPRGGYYTIYLALDDYLPAVRDGDTITDRLPGDATPKLSDTAFTAFAVANLDNDADLDVWMIDESGELRHVYNDVPWLPQPRELSAPPGQDAEGQTGTLPLAAGDKTLDGKAPPKNEAPDKTAPAPDSKAHSSDGKGATSADDKGGNPAASTGGTGASDTDGKTTTSTDGKGAATTDKAATSTDGKGASSGDKSATSADGKDASGTVGKTTAERASTAGSTKKAEEPPAPKPAPIKLDKPPLGNPNASPIRPPSVDKPAKPAADPQPADKPVTPT